MNGNRFMGYILRSPFHKMISSSTLLITVKGCKSGKPITAPVNYAMDGNKILVTSFRQRKWWRNLRGGQPVNLWLKGREVRGWGNVIETGPEVEKSLHEFLKLVPQYAKYYQVSLNETGEPIHADIERAANERVMVEILLQ